MFLMLFCSMTSFSFLRAIYQVFFRFPSLLHWPLYIFASIQTQCHKHMLLSPKCSLSSKAWNEEEKEIRFVRQHVFAYCFKTGPKITVAICGYQGFIQTTELRNMNLCDLFWRPPAHTLTLFLLPTESPLLCHQLRAQNTSGSIFKHL